MGIVNSLPANYEVCADEGGKCVFDRKKPRALYYGAGDKFKVIPISHIQPEYNCTNESAGGDPNPDVPKQCFIPSNDFYNTECEGCEECKECNCVAKLDQMDGDDNLYGVKCINNSGIEGFGNLSISQSSSNINFLIIIIVLLLIYFFYINNQQKI